MVEKRDDVAACCLHFFYFIFEEILFAFLDHHLLLCPKKQMIETRVYDLRSFMRSNKKQQLTCYATEVSTRCLEQEYKNTAVRVESMFTWAKPRMYYNTYAVGVF